MYKCPWRFTKIIININWTSTQGLPSVRWYFNTKSAMYHTYVSHTDTFPSFTEKCGKIVNLDFNRDLTTSLVISFWSKKIISMSYQCSWVFEASQEILTQWIGTGTKNCTYKMDPQKTHQRHLGNYWARSVVLNFGYTWKSPGEL